MWNVLSVIMMIIGLHLVVVSQAGAFAVGDLAIYSRQGEPLVAEVPLFLEARERAKGTKVTLGTVETYQAEGMKRPPVLDVLTAVVGSTGDAIRITSQVPIREPKFPLLLSIRVGQVTIVKQYHLALPASSPAIARTAVPLPTIAPLTPAARASKTATRSRTARRSAPRPERYGPIERGETLYGVVSSLSIPPERLWQGVVALWRANKEHFVAGNMHGLNVGTYLDVPADLSESITAMRLTEVQELVASQWEEWQALQQLGTGKQRVIAAAAARDPETAIAAHGRREVAGRREATPQPTEKPPAQSVVLPVGKAGNMVSMTELQNVLQGLEDRLLRRMTPTTSPEFKSAAPGSTTFVSASELQASIQSLEERLTQRMQQILLHTQTPEPLLVAQRSPQHTLQLVPMPVSADNTQSAAMTLVPYLLVLINVLLLALMGVVLWIWLRRRDRATRMQRVS